MHFLPFAPIFKLRVPLLLLLTSPPQCAPRLDVSKEDMPMTIREQVLQWHRWGRGCLQ